MILVSLASDLRMRISEDRGPHARGCHLDPDVLLSAMAEALADLQHRPSILILNKFGKSEGEGGGFRNLIVEALEREIPVLIGVPWRNIEIWREFAGEFAVEITTEAVAEASGAALLSRLGLTSTFERRSGPQQEDRSEEQHDV
jgi:hypothetical protein